MKLKYCLLIAFIGIGILPTGCRKPAPGDDKVFRPTVAAVQVQEIEPRVWQQTIRSFGKIEAAEKATISAEIAGKVNDVLFNEGDQIEAGQKLLSFDISESRMRLKQAEGNLSGVAAQLDEARSMLSRRENLFRQHAITKEQLESARTNVATLAAQYEQMVVGKSLARHNIQRTQLHSPVSGTVVSKGIDTGEVAMPGQPLAVIHVTDTMRVTTWVSQEEVNTIRTGIACKVTTSGVRGRTWVAHVESVGNVADPSTGNFAVKLTVNNADGLLKAGMSAMVTLSGLEMNDAILIPDSAVVDRHRKRVVYVVKNQRAVEIEPVLAASTNAIRNVLHGLSKGDQLIVGGLDDVADGSKLKIIGKVPFDDSLTRAAPKNDDNLNEPLPESTHNHESTAPERNRQTQRESQS